MDTEYLNHNLQANYFLDCGQWQSLFSCLYWVFPFYPTHCFIVNLYILYIGIEPKLQPPKQHRYEEVTEVLGEGHATHSP